MRTTIASIFAALLTASIASAQHHIHITVDTFVDGDTPTTRIDAGYNASEAAFDIDADGRLTEDGDIAVFRLVDPAPAALLPGWHAGLALTLTSDFYFATGRLAGGDFHYELVAVEPAAPTSPPADAVLGIFHGATPTIEADSTALDRTARSFPVGAGGHPHGQFQALSARGLYDITLIAWDANALYADSEPVTFRVNTCAADLTNDGTVDVFDLLGYLDAWFAADPHAADLTGDGTVDVFDLLGYLDLWFAGC